MRQAIFPWLHSSAQGGHSEIVPICHRVKGLFYWKGWRKEDKNFILICEVYMQEANYDTSTYLGLIQALPISRCAWHSISMEFIEGWPKFMSKGTNWVMVNRLSKYGHILFHFLTLLLMLQWLNSTLFTFISCLEHLARVRDPIFVSNFWREILEKTKI